MKMIIECWIVWMKSGRGVLSELRGFASGFVWVDSQVEFFLLVYWLDWGCNGFIWGMGAFNGFWLALRVRFVFCFGG